VKPGPEAKATGLSLDLSQVHLKVLAEHLPVGVVIHHQGFVRFANPALLRMLGYGSLDELMGVQVLSLVHPDERGLVLARVQRNARGEVSPSLEERLLRKDGSTAYAEVSGLPVVFDSQPMVMALFKDISNDRAAAQEVARSRKKQVLLEENLRQAQKMEAIGQLAGGVAHDFNNLLMVIMGNCQMLLEGADCQGDAKLRLQEMLDSSELAASITRQLLTFSRRQVSEKRVFDLEGKILGARSLLRRLLPADVELDMDLGPEPAWINADPADIEQILLNLSVNARDAMPTGGRLGIHTFNIQLGGGWQAGILDLAPGPYVVLSIQDTGEGMDETVRGRIFEPFFTTKEPGKGTGMGLSTVFGIVRSLGGAIRVESALGMGSSFDIYLPRQAQGPAEAAPPSAHSTALAGNERVLLVEDEASLRRTLSLALHTHGYEVIEADSGSQALDLVALSLLKPDAVISDLVMPGMNGLKVIEALRREHGVRHAILLSGYADPSLSVDTAAFPNEDFFQKPVRLERILARLREQLDGAGQPRAAAA
jgi:PAS domain S-box-containing protein